MSSSLKGNKYPAEKCLEASGFMKAAILSPLEDIMTILQKSWSDEEASRVFSGRIAAHRNNLQDIHKLLEKAAREMAEMQEHS